MRAIAICQLISQSMKIGHTHSSDVTNLVYEVLLHELLFTLVSQQALAELSSFGPLLFHLLVYAQRGWPCQGRHPDSTG